MARQGDIEAEWELANVPKLPPLASHLWGWWIELCATRGSTGFALAPLTRLEIQAWESDEGHRLDPWERKAILNLDAAYRRIMAAEEKG